ncbi:MAG: hypothetical protein BWY09_01397 [Candidatus Hydrogenedentes bacterium ADurb.Bin179]|nr:MAG: hypothetical protein BWY09_01397 [Candidatus Hydrogenedentes bacterium ADurb.Bin179]
MPGIQRLLSKQAKQQGSGHWRVHCIPCEPPRREYSRHPLSGPELTEQRLYLRSRESISAPFRLAHNRKRASSHKGLLFAHHPALCWPSIFSPPWGRHECREHGGICHGQHRAAGVRREWPRGMPPRAAAPTRRGGDSARETASSVSVPAETQYRFLLLEAILR